MAISSSASGRRQRIGAAAAVQKLGEVRALDGIGGRGNLLSISIGNLDRKLIFERHYNLDGVEAVQAEVVHEVRGGRHLGGVHFLVVLQATQHAISDITLIQEGRSEPTALLHHREGGKRLRTGHSWHRAREQGRPRALRQRRRRTARQRDDAASHV